MSPAGRRPRARLGLLGQLLPLFLALPGGTGEAPAAGSNCSFLQEMDVIQKRDESCYCYVQNRTIHLQYVWSTLRVKVNSREMFRFEPISQNSNCRNSETVFEFAACAVQVFWKPETATETRVSIKQYGEDICFKIQPLKTEPYIVSVKREMLDGKLLFLFIAGIFLFHFATSLSRNTKFFYLCGIILGVLALLVFVLLILKRFIPRHSTFWILMSGCWMSSLYFIYCFKENMQWLWSEHRNYLLGYFLAVGMTSFAACYQHGPPTTDLSISLFAWTLQLTAFVLIYCGVTIPQVAYAVIVVSLCSKGLCYPLGAACHIGRKMKNHFISKKLVFKHLTEEEYREQGETETIRALEELRLFCRNRDFPSWLAVSKLQSPHRFADFVLGSPHISPAETRVHEEEYGIGSFFLEEQLFETGTESEQDDPTNSIHEGDDADEDEMHKQISFPYATELL
ncbi:nuclear envelope integral membrane protein 2 isoform X1 [Neopsephotus bourkii]|uniref:nuclear envelope integral membrane protein 2 isoform X1 n=3 Tax=Neopsephotus bourkii TaxID=309878 RepID=UPI002AA55DC8|nr:nuclear envelope integral membrane protein 2 isoform X1 [Neopsephotus bourkii]